MSRKLCPICGKPVKKPPAQYCSPQCRAEAAKHYKPCVICGSMFWCAPSEGVSTCSDKCSSEYRSIIMHRMEGNAAQLAGEARAYAASHTAEKNPTAGHYVIQSPSGSVTEIVNLRHWVHNSGLFDNPASAYNAFTKIISTLNGTRTSKRMYSYHGYRILSHDKGNLLHSKANTTPPKYCRICGAQIHSKRRSYCSDECAAKAHRQSEQNAYHKNKPQEDTP